MSVNSPLGPRPSDLYLPLDDDEDGRGGGELDRLPAAAADGYAPLGGAGDDDAADGKPEKKKKKKEKRRYCWGRLSRCQLVSLSVFLFLVVTTLVGVLVVGRALAEHMMNHTDVRLREVHLRDPAETGPCGGQALPGGANRSMCVRVVADVERKVPVRASVSAAAVRVLVPGADGRQRQVGLFHMPRLEFSAGERPHVDQWAPFEVTDAALFAEFNNDRLVPAIGSVEWGARASLHVTAHLWWVVRVGYEGLDYHHSVAAPGLGGMRNVTIEGYDLPRNAPGGRGVELEANATLYSAGPYYVELGETEFDLYYRNSTGRLGRVTLARTSLRPGANRVSVRGVLDPTARGDRVLSPFFSAYAARRPGLELIVRGVGAGPGVPDWARTLVRALTLRVPVVSTLNLDVVRSINVRSVNCTFAPDGSPVVGASVSSSFASPFGFPLQVLEVGLNVSLLSTATGLAMGGVHIPPVPVQGRMGQDNVSVSFGRQERLRVTDAAAFNALVRSVLLEPEVTVLSRATVDVRFLSALGNVWVRGIPLPRPIAVSLRGFDKFAGVRVTNGRLLRANGSRDAMEVTSEVVIGNPSSAAADVGPLLVNMTYDSPQYGLVSIGTAFLPDARLALGNGTRTVATATLMPGAAPLAGPAIDEFISRYIRQDRGIRVGMHGRPDSTRIPLLRPVLATTALELDFAVPKYQFIKSVNVRVDVVQLKITANVVVFNPMPVEISVTRMTIPTYDTDGREIYKMERSEPLLVPGGTHEVDVSVPLSGLEWNVLKDAFGAWKRKEIEVALGGTISFLVPPAFERTVEYEATGLLAHLHIHVL